MRGCCHHHDDVDDDDAENDADYDDAEHTVLDISLWHRPTWCPHHTTSVPLCLSQRPELPLTVLFLLFSKGKKYPKTHLSPFLSQICCNLVMTWLVKDWLCPKISGKILLYTSNHHLIVFTCCWLWWWKWWLIPVKWRSAAWMMGTLNWAIVEELAKLSDGTLSTANCPGTVEKC